MGKTLTLLMVTVALLQGCGGDPPLEWFDGSFSEARLAASRGGRLLFLNFSTDW